MNDLEKYFKENNKRRIFKWNHYFEIYNRHFSRFRNKKINILEIGVLHGGSLQMWKSYFGPQAMIFGIDIDPRCKQFDEENIRIFTGSQSDRGFLEEVKKQIPRIDILIDDGGHEMDQQITSFEMLFDHINDDGIYVCEDLHTSYWPDFKGGYKKPGTFIEYSKNFIDEINAFHSQTEQHKVNSFTRSVHSITYYDSMIVIEKRKIEPPFTLKTGKKSW
jgi:cephalosporin hydroxylase